MPSLKDLKNRITRSNRRRRLPKAMQMVAASKLRRAQESAEAARARMLSVWKKCWRALVRHRQGPAGSAPAFGPGYGQ